jgi:transposase
MCKDNFAAYVKEFVPQSPVAEVIHAVAICTYTHTMQGNYLGSRRRYGLDLICLCGIIMLTYFQGGPVARNRISRKAQALRQHGSLNPRPEAVRHELFQSGEFFDPADLVQVKYEMLRRVRVDRSSVSEAAAEFGLSRPSFYEAQAAFAEGGLPGLMPAKRGPRRAHKLDAEVVKFLRAAKAEDPTLSGAALRDKLWQERRLRVHRRSIERALARSQKKRTVPMRERS